MKQVFVAAMLALVLAPLAQAGGPVQSTTPWDRTRVIPASAEIGRASCRERVLPTV